MAKISPCHGAWSGFESRREDMMGTYNPGTNKTIKTVVTEEYFDSEGNLTKRVVTETTETTSTGGYTMPGVYGGGIAPASDKPIVTY